MVGISAGEADEPFLSNRHLIYLNVGSARVQHRSHCGLVEQDDRFWANARLPDPKLSVREHGRNRSKGVMNKRLRLRHLVLVICFTVFPLTLLAQHPFTAHYRDGSIFRGRANPGLQMKSMMFAFQLQNRRTWNVCCRINWIPSRRITIAG
jgi:hypothetical protein